jgi:SpoIID/LytB domain protein
MLLALAGLVLAALVVPAPAAGAATPGSLTVTGHGWGHGRGMGQWGARGYAEQGWSSAQILDHYYGGTTAGSIDPGAPMSVRLLAQDGRDLVVTSGAPFVVGGITVDPWRCIRVTQVGPSFEMRVAPSCGAAELADYRPSFGSGPVHVSSTVGDPGADINLMLTVLNADGLGNNVSYRGTLAILAASDGLHTVNTLGTDLYLRGVVPREMPSSWPAPALQSQAVAARSYSTAENRYAYAKTCDTTSCQVYTGAGKSGAYIEAGPANAAIAATAGVVRRGAGGAVARTEFSASTGGWTAGGTFPAVRDDGDAIAANPHHTWTTAIPIADIESRYGIGVFQAIFIDSRNGLGDMGGRVQSLRIVGSSGTVTRTGSQFRSDWGSIAGGLGVRSDWFTVGTPYLTWNLRHANAPGPPDNAFAFGARGYKPVLCDWNNDGVDTVGVYVNGSWYLRNSNSPGGADITPFAYGTSAYVPVCGDWNGDGVETVGVYDRGTWYLRNSNTPGPPDIVVAYGGPHDLPVVGNWDGAGGDSLGVFSNGNWYLRNGAGAPTPGPPTDAFAFGAPGYVPVTSNWDAIGGDSVAVYVGGQWYLRNALAPGPPDVSFAFGAPGYVPLAGHLHASLPVDTVLVVAPPTA